jgi:hypothetical protein
MPTEVFEAVSALGLVLLTGLWILFQGQRTSNRLRKAATAAVHALCQIPLTPSPENHQCWASLLRHASVLAGREVEDVEKRLLFYLRDGAGIYWDPPVTGQTCNLREAAQLLGPVRHAIPLDFRRGFGPTRMKYCRNGEDWSQDETPRPLQPCTSSASPARNEHPNVAGARPSRTARYYRRSARGPRESPLLPSIPFRGLATVDVYF